jgi:hypothetical protein
MDFLLSYIYYRVFAKQNMFLPPLVYTVRSESCCALRLRYVDLVVSIEVSVEVAFVSQYLVVKQRLNCNTGKVCNCLIQFSLTMVLSIEEHLL